MNSRTCFMLVALFIFGSFMGCASNGVQLISVEGVQWTSEPGVLQHSRGYCITMHPNDYAVNVHAYDSETGILQVVHLLADEQGETHIYSTWQRKGGRLILPNEPRPNIFQRDCLEFVKNLPQNVKDLFRGSWNIESAR